jgi:hypothetical protein
LEQGAELQRQEPSPFLQARIVACLNRSNRCSEPSPDGLTPLWARSLAPLGLLLIGGVLLYNFMPRRAPVVPPLSPPTAAAAATDLFSAEVSLVNGQALLDLSQHLEQPLAAEVELVISDAKAAVQMLAKNLLPSRIDGISQGTGQNGQD